MEQEVHVTDRLQHASIIQPTGNADMKKLFVLLLLVLASGCKPMLESSSAGSVMLSNVRHHNADDALRMAEAECQKNQRHAVPIGNRPHRGQLSYECKP